VRTAVLKANTDGESLWVRDSSSGELTPKTSSDIIVLENTNSDKCRVYPNTRKNGIVVRPR